MSDSMTVLERNLVAWVRTAPLPALRLALDLIGFELLIQRGAGAVEQAGVDALRAANRLRTLTFQPDFEVLDVAGALEVLGRAAAKYQGERGGS